MHQQEGYSWCLLPMGMRARRAGLKRLTPAFRDPRRLLIRGTQQSADMHTHAEQFCIRWSVC
jgi:hypothetical protein